MPTMTTPNPTLGASLARARERAGFSQDEVATLVGQLRPVISNWENGSRRPNDHQLAKLAVIYRTPLSDLLSGEPRSRPDFERLLFRDAGDRLDPPAKYEIQRFLAFLDGYGDLLEALDEPSGMTDAPLSLREGFLNKEDVRRKAEDARAFFRLGLGPVGDIAGLADLHGITVYLAPLGADLKGTVSGAFLPHDRVGFSILVNAETTPGRRQFTLAHELGHALFHGERIYVDYYGRREAEERFVSAFAAEFLVPTQSLRAAVEAYGLQKVRDPEVVVHLQRLFRVSYAMMLVRLANAHLATKDDVERLGTVHPVHLAERLGYSIEPDEWKQDAERLGIARFPRRFLRVLRRALTEGQASVSSAANLMGLAEEDVEEFLADGDGAGERTAEELEYLQAS
jgi:transcriptional regulator with XRE-family HTH domain